MKSYTGTGCSIYKHTNKINGKVYIGQTSREDLTRRWTGGSGYRGCRYMYHAIQKYGWDNFTHEILFTGLSFEEADKKEQELIALYRSNDRRYGYNIRSGGADCHTISEEARSALREKLSGGNSPVAKAVRLYKASGEFFREFETAKDADSFLGCSEGMVSACCRGKSASIFGYRCYFSEVIGNLEMLPEDEIREIGPVRKNFRPVNQYTFDGKFVKTYPSIKDAASAFRNKKGDIYGALSEKAPTHKTACGYMWRYSDGTTNDIAPLRKKNTSGGYHYAACAVFMVDPLTKKIVNRFSSFKEAANFMCVAPSSIANATKRDGATVKGYCWVRDANNQHSRSALRKRHQIPPGSKRINIYDPKTGTLIKTFDTMVAAAKFLNVSHASITHCAKGKTKTCSGYCVEYAE